MSNQWWSSAGSAGTVDIADLGKVVFDKSIVQLQGFDLVVGAANAAQPPVVSPFPVTRAVIRYGVTPVEGVLLGGYALRLRYRDGAGQVVAHLIQVDIASGTETPVASFDSGLFPRRNDFRVNTGGSSATLDFENNAYYVELTLTAAHNPVTPVLFPPKVSVVQLVLLIV
jgi:hypothetical protein